MAPLTFEPFQTTISPLFWSDLVEYKLYEAKLDSSRVLVRGQYECGRSRIIHSKDKNVQPRVMALQSRFQIEFIKKEERNLLFSKDDLLNNVYSKALNEKLNFVYGYLYNTNTIEEFKAIDRNKLLRQVSQEVNQLSSLYLKFHKENLSSEKFFVAGYTKSPKKNLNMSAPIWRLAPLSEYKTIKQESSEAIVCFLDPCGQSNVCGWPLRNLLVWFRKHYPSPNSKFICFKDPSSSQMEISNTDTKNLEHIYQSIIYEIPTDQDLLQDFKSIGWERNSTGKLLPKLANLQESMDPAKLAGSSLDLNLQLMKWRLAPSLDLNKISSTKCLLFGAGTLGCSVARVLLGWGVRNITFVDNGQVSYSNPPRQSLFNFSDIGKPKAVAAAESMMAIFPGVESKGFQLTIPMPGHSVSPSSSDSVLKTCEILHELVNNHDTIFCLTDSRESRWLPTLLGAVCNKLVICSALGFDSFVVMRHGRPLQSNVEAISDKQAQNIDSRNDSIKPINRLGCYFCNDVVAPIDSMSNRSLDQQCTVTRPGLAPIAASYAVELMVALSQHPNGADAYPEIKGQRKDIDSADFESNSSSLSHDGNIPHQIRGYLGKFEQNLIFGNAYDKCTACSKIVIDAYLNRASNNFLMNTFNNNVIESNVGGETGSGDGSSYNYLEELTGLAELHRKTNLAMEEMDLIDDDFEADEDFEEIE
ncbi:Ubiquitin-like modifier-activating enzyme ATG7 [Smittium culicis]|uniref:Ubiquitin-like modifier-activating enzyme ATG7 n=1 Tax=Smittium culicis TaxID=133412 RepID=A0A1R1XPZ3_9FUNG|nr:Ubiquitin-like modifier-activating enzyme ATG7 [Smittium culicis]